MYLVPPVNEAGKTISLPIKEGSVSPLLIASYNPLRISQRINFRLALMKDDRCASTIV